MVAANPRIDSLRHALDANGPTALDAFWEKVSVEGTPLIEPVDAATSLVTFLWRGQAGTTSVEWGVQHPLEQLAGTDLWHATVPLPSDLRTVYFLAHDGADNIPTTTDEGPSHIDSLNRHPFRFPGDPTDPTDRDYWVSLLELPHAPAEPWLAPVPGPARGRTLEATIASAALQATRHVSVHLPADREPDDLPVLVVFDGHLSRTVLGVTTTVDNLIAAGRIAPLAVILVNTPDAVRNDELSTHPPIVDFVTGELLPWARRQWRVGGADPAGNAIAGASRGGLVAAYIGLCRPDVFGAVISQSGSFWWPGPEDGEAEWLTRQYAAQPRLPLRFYLDVGNRETGPAPDGGPSQLLVNRRLRDTLRERGYAVAYAEYTGAHDYVNWRRTFADGLIAVLGQD